MSSRLQLNSRKRVANHSMAEQDQATYDKLTKELKVLREEIHNLRQEVVRTGATDTNEAAFGFDKAEFLNMSPTKCLQWVATTLAPKLKEEANKYPSYFGPIKLMAMPAEMVVWTCAGFNRGSQCKAKWHVYERPKASSSDIRLHCCTLCYDGLGILSEHRILDCPWLKESNWIEIRGGTKREADREADLELDSTACSNDQSEMC
jgi:hypothetical protein